MNRETWKASERRWALALGGQRVPVTGRQRGSAPDVEHPDWAIEVKMGKVMSSRLLTAWDQAHAAAAGTRKRPMVCIEQTIGPGHANRRYVMLELEDWLAWNGPVDEMVHHLNSEPDD